MCPWKNINDIVSKFESVSKVMFNWFSENNLQANPYKSQFILFTNDLLCNAVNIDTIILHPLGSVKLLGVHVDRELNFNGHVTTICKKAGRQLNTLGRLANVLRVDDKNILFECFILSHFNFFSTVWHCCSLADIKKKKCSEASSLLYL